MDHYLVHFPGEKVFLSQVLDAISRVKKTGNPVLFDFLNPYQMTIVESVAGQNDIAVAFDGGMDHAEYKRALFSPDEDNDFAISVIAVTWQKKFNALTHRDILGALMSLGLKRSVIGDIYITPGKAYVACKQELAGLLLNELKKIRRGSVKTSLCQERIIKEEHFETVMLPVSALRLDVLIAEAWHLSRSQAQALIRAQNVKVNYKEVVQFHYLCHNNDMISVAGHGRFKISETGRVNRKNKPVVEIRFFR